MTTDDLNAQSRQIWDTNAAAWDAKIAAGGGWQSNFIAPNVERLLHVQAGELVLELACGNGIFARRLAALGASVVASDFSPKLIELAQQRTAPDLPITYHVADATDETQLLALASGERRFDAAVCNMALMDMPQIVPLFRAVSQMLKPSGRFVFSVMHPCFNGADPIMLAERHLDVEESIHAIKISRYLDAGTTVGLAIREQPREQYYWHRPIAVLLGAAFAAGFVADAFEEPPAPGPASGELSWANFDMPPLLFVRLRLG